MSESELRGKENNPNLILYEYYDKGRNQERAQWIAKINALLHTIQERRNLYKEEIKTVDIDAFDEEITVEVCLMIINDCNAQKEILNQLLRDEKA